MNDSDETKNTDGQFGGRGLDSILPLMAVSTIGLAMPAYGPVFVVQSQLTGVFVSLVLVALGCVLSAPQFEAGGARKLRFLSLAMMWLAFCVIAYRHVRGSEESPVAPLLFGLGTLLLTLNMWRPSKVSRRLGWVLAMVPALMQLAFIAFVSHGIAWVYSRLGLALLLVVELLLLVALIRGAQRWRFAVLACATVLIVWTSPLLMFVMWQPLTVAECSEVDAQNHVKRLAPTDRQDGLPQPYDIEYIADENLFIATVKMAGNLIIPFWEDSSANGVYAIRAHALDSTEIVYLSLAGDTMPENLLHLPHKRSVVMTGLSATGSKLWWLDLTGFPRLSVSQSVDIDAEIVIAARAEKDSKIGVLTNDSRLLWVSDSGEQKLDEVPLPDVNGILFGWQHPDAPLIYLSNLSQDVVEVNLESAEVRRARVSTAVGHVYGLPASDLLLQTDFALHKLHVIDRKSMKRVRELDLPYAPRDVVASEELDLLVVPEWFGGKVHFYRLSTLAKLEATVEVGQYTRCMAIDSTRRMLVVGSKCGLYLVDLAKLLEI